MLMSLPVYLPNKIRSPTFTSIGTRRPFSIFPGPTATTSPSCGFSLAVSGMMMPDFATSFASSLVTNMRSCSGVTFKAISLTSVYHCEKFKAVSVGLERCLRSKGFHIFLPGYIKVIRYLFLTVDFLLRRLLLVQFHRFGDGSLGCGIEPS